MIKWSKPSPKSQSCRQHISSPTSVTNISKLSPTCYQTQIDGYYVHCWKWNKYVFKLKWPNEKCRFNFQIIRYAAYVMHETNVKSRSVRVWQIRTIALDSIVTHSHLNWCYRNNYHVIYAKWSQNDLKQPQSDHKSYCKLFKSSPLIDSVRCIELTQN